MILICSVHVSFVSADVAPDSFLQKCFNRSTFCQQFVLWTIFFKDVMFISKKRIRQQMSLNLLECY